MPITKIISSGTAGPERGALDGALEYGVDLEGWCPKNKQPTGDNIPEGFKLWELDYESEEARPIPNVIESDAILLFTHGTISGDTLKIIEYCRKARRPFERIDLLRTGRLKAIQLISRWLLGTGDNDYDDYVATPPENCILYVTGDRESKSPGIQQEVYLLMRELLNEVNGFWLYPIGEE
ncbi:hypothetical protein PDESU_00416 [Pontiella desulfatans]|uniref:Molybdenum carrier n=1 Tax=Pontiella desulfatans TaxID=2750659 RepID=A0A6C2TW79_PONDE|nr:putative molybdenum carrier protein [Pontiella desulfatans]VGO11869.1 hypothetical protein PDESU_00416 [Pontiella desulfatans]